MRRFIFLLIFIFINSILLAQTKTFNIHSIRLKYFLISNLPDPILKSPPELTHSLFKGYSPIGQFKILKSSSSNSICELVSGSHKYLGHDCYFKYDIPTKKELSPSPNVETKAPPVQVAAPQTEAKPKEIPPFSVMNIQFRHINNIITSSVIPYSRFGSIKELNSFLNQLDKQSQQKYKFNIPSESIVQRNSSLFETLTSGKFGLCTFNGRIGYFRFEDKKPVFKNIQLETLSQFANDVLVIIVSTEV